MRSRHLRWNASSPTDEHLVDEEDLGLDVDGQREGEPRVHARRVVLHLVVDERLELGERDDLVEDLRDVAPRQAEDRPVQEEVLAAGEVGVESGAELEERGDAAGLAHVARWSAAACRRRT